MTWLSWLTVVLGAISIVFTIIQKLPDKVINSLFGPPSADSRLADAIVVLGLLINASVGPLIVAVLAIVDGFAYGWRPINWWIPPFAVALQWCLWRWFGDDLFGEGEKTYLLNER